MNILSVQAKDNFLLKVTFENNEVKSFDVKPYLDMEVFNPLRRETLFRKVKCRGYYIAWPEEVEISGDTLYAEGQII